MTTLIATSSIALLVLSQSSIGMSIKMTDPHRDCPVSSLIDPTTDGVFPYPEFYFTDIYDISKPTKFPAFSTQYSCNTNHLLCQLEQPFDNEDSKQWTKELYNRHQRSNSPQGHFQGNNTICATNLCPIQDSNMNATWAIQEWDFRADALCHLKEGAKLRKGEESTKTRVIAFGGSMTRGHGALEHGCISAMEYLEADLAKKEGRPVAASVLRSDKCKPGSPNLLNKSKW